MIPSGTEIQHPAEELHLNKKLLQQDPMTGSTILADYGKKRT
jgi:hypothetical protein